MAVNCGSLNLSLCVKAKVGQVDRLWLKRSVAFAAISWCVIFFFLHVQYFKQILYPTLCCIIGVDVKVVIVVIIVVIVIVVVIVVVVVGVDDVDDGLHRDQHEWHEPKSWELGSRRAEVSGGVGAGHGHLALWEN